MFGMEPKLIGLFLNGLKAKQICAAVQICWPGLVDPPPAPPKK